MPSVCVRPLILLLPLLWLTACQDDSAKLTEHISRGESYVEDERYPEAVIEYRSALQIDPNHAGAHFALAHTYLRLGKAREGFWELRETVRLDPANHDAKIEFSQLAIFAEEHEEALKQTESVIAEDPENIRAYLVRSQALAGPSDKSRRPPRRRPPLRYSSTIRLTHSWRSVRPKGSTLGLRFPVGACPK